VRAGPRSGDASVARRATERRSAAQESSVALVCAQVYSGMGADIVYGIVTLIVRSGVNLLVLLISSNPCPWCLIIDYPAWRRSWARWMVEMREMAATIMLESSCMVATSRSSKAPGVDESTSKTPKVRR